MTKTSAPPAEVVTAAEAAGVDPDDLVNAKDARVIGGYQTGNTLASAARNGRLRAFPVTAADGRVVTRWYVRQELIAKNAEISAAGNVAPPHQTPTPPGSPDRTPAQDKELVFVVPRVEHELEIALERQRSRTVEVTAERDALQARVDSLTRVVQELLTGQISGATGPE